LQQKFSSTGTGALTNYETSTGAFGAQVALGLWGTAGRFLLFGGDASYTFAGGAQLKYTPMQGAQPVLLSIQSHTGDAGVTGAVHFNVLGGLTLRLRIGAHLVLNAIQQDVRAKLPSDLIIGLSLGTGITVPALFYINERPVGVSAFTAGLLPAERQQTPGLEDGAQSSTWGALVAGALSFALLSPSYARSHGQLALEFDYGYEFATTHYTGPAKRNTSINGADRGSAQHLITAGLTYYY
jgi:hypothetical protein